MANCWPKRAAQGPQLKRRRPWSHRSRDSTASLPQRGHVTPSGQRNCRKSSAAFWSSCRYGIRCFIGLLQRDASDHIILVLSGGSCYNALLLMSEYEKNFSGLACTRPLDASAVCILVQDEDFEMAMTHIAPNLLRIVK